MKDGFGREISYLRISLTERCNLRCRYCRPEKGEKSCPDCWETDGVQRENDGRQEMSPKQLQEVCEVAADLGIRSIRLTGGEPLLRRDLAEIISRIRGISGIRRIALTTNGIFLAQKLPELMTSGLDDVNISADSLQREQYRRITGGDLLHCVCEGIEACVEAGIPVKLNCVAGHFEQAGEAPGWKSVLEMARRRPIDVRMIELMPIGQGRGFTAISGYELKEEIRLTYGALIPDAESRGNGPAVYYRIPGFAGRLGLITAVHDSFCSSCNRIRLTAEGNLKSCLCYASSTSLQQAWQIAEQKKRREEIRRQLICCIQGKPAAHCFDTPSRITEALTMEKIGG